MKKVITGIFTGVVIVLSALAFLSGCSSTAVITTPAPTSSFPPAASSPTASQPSPSASSVQAEADPLVENILLSLNNNDYAGFSKNLDQNAKSILTQTSFNQLYSLIKSTVGVYQSKEFVSSATRGSATTFQYIAFYSSEPANVSVNGELQTSNGVLYISGVSLDSPKLQGKLVDINQVRAYADPETANLLSSLTKNDYSGFIKDLDQAMSALETKATFAQTYNLIKTSVGDYVSQQFGLLTLQNNFTVIKYHAVYTNEPAGVWVTVSFDGSNKVSGLFFDSPRLRAAQTK
jgi:hypothetical protein